MTTNTRSEWLAVAEEFMAEEFERLGGPPTPEEVVAYAKGTLSEEEANRVRALLVYEPALTDVLAEPAPQEMPRRNTWGVSLAAAALAVLVVGSLFTLFESRGPEVPLVLHSIPTRGPSSERVFSVVEDASRYRFTIVLMQPKSATYRVEIFDADARSERVLWSTDQSQRRGDDTIEVTVDGDVLERGAYVLRVRGDAEEERFNISVVPKETE
jgi:hypothetical protein